MAFHILAKWAADLERGDFRLRRGGTHYLIGPPEKLTEAQREELMGTATLVLHAALGQKLGDEPSLPCRVAMERFEGFLGGKLGAASIDEYPVRVPVSLKVTGRDETSVTESTTIRLRPPEEHFPGRAALLSALGGMLLMGGLVLCVMVAMKHHRKGPPGFEEEAEG